MYRVGLGFDVHPFMDNRPLVLGGVTIPNERGLEGDSDADVLAHSLIDALLGALALGDIGRVFGVGTPEVMGIRSLILLERTMTLIHEKGYHIVNVDATIIAQVPKLGPHLPSMMENLCPLLKIESDALSLKATTPKHLGALGDKQGIAVQSIVLLQKDSL